MPRLSPVAAFWARVDKSAGPDACWPWTGSTFRSGYGQIGNRHLPVLAHRAAHQLTHGAIPRGACVLHRCDNPLCCNPAHLFVGSARDNARDKAAKGRCRNYVLGVSLDWLMRGVGAEPDKDRVREAVELAQADAPVKLAAASGE